MNWEYAGIVAEIVSAAAVVITLAYLAVQIKLSREASQVETSYTTVELYGNWRSHLIENNEIATIIAKANCGEELTPAEDIRIATLIDDLFVTLGNTHVGGVTGNAFYDASGEINYAERLFEKNPGLVPYWRDTREYVINAIPEFVAAMDAHLEGKTFPLRNPDSRHLTRQ